MSPTRRAALQTLGTVGAVAVAGCSTVARLRGPNQRPPDSLGTDWSPPGAEWRYPNADLRNTASVDLVATSAPAPAWRIAPPDADVFAGAVVATRDTVVEQATRDDRGAVSARAAADGSVRWRRTFEADTVNVSSHVDNSLYVTIDRRAVVALDAADGTTRWRADLLSRLRDAVPARFLARGPREFWPHVLATPDTVYVQTGYGLHGLDPADGTERWRLYLGDPDGDADERVRRDPRGFALGEHEVWASYGGGYRRTLVEVTVIDGEPHVDAGDVALEYPTAPTAVGSETNPPLVFGQWVASTGFVEPIAAGDPLRSDRDWTFGGFAAPGGPSRTTGVATDGNRMFVCQVRRVEEGYELGTFALDPDTGALVWSRRDSVPLGSDADFFDRCSLARPAVAGDTLLVAYGADPPAEDADPTRALVGLSTADGTERWRVDPGIQPRQVAVAGDRLYITGEHGGFAAFARSA